MNQREIKNGQSKFDALDNEGGDVTALLGALPRVEASENFEFGVRAKIAKGSPRRAGFIPFLKVAAPLSLVFGIAGLGLFYGTLPTETGDSISKSTVNDLPAVATAQTETGVATPAATSSNPQIAEPPAIQPERASAGRERTTQNRRSPNSASNMHSTEGGSTVFMLESANTKNPRGIEPNLNPGSRNLNANVGSSQIPVRDVFGMLGIDADFIESGWKVRSITENSVASRAKIQTGDIVEAIDGQQLKGSSISKGSATIITVRRDGKTLNLNLK